ncbi:hypothetical protein [Vibrio coralliilyticus]|uniref:hypothetical protein n=1 Tax=Vibrio coralliilyticus TaxID=190893 RepID=UPI001E5031A7|nr:hypothetical protein [Vibrio coralliilyticus]MCC2522302.1 hypothetical protein [Vibrio coralliilyticus]
MALCWVGWTSEEDLAQGKIKENNMYTEMKRDMTVQHRGGKAKNLRDGGSKARRRDTGYRERNTAGARTARTNWRPIGKRSGEPTLQRWWRFWESEGQKHAREEREKDKKILDEATKEYKTDLIAEGRQVITQAERRLIELRKAARTATTDQGAWIKDDSALIGSIDKCIEALGGLRGDEAAWRKKARKISAVLGTVSGVISAGFMWASYGQSADGPDTYGHVKIGFGAAAAVATSVTMLLRYLKTLDQREPREIVEALRTLKGGIAGAKLKLESSNLNTEDKTSKPLSFDITEPDPTRKTETTQDKDEGAQNQKIIELKQKLME